MSVRKRKDGHWGFDITIKRGGVVLRREKKFGFKTKREAAEAETARRAELLAGGSETQPVRATTFAEHAQEVVVLHANVNNKHSERMNKRRIFDGHLVPAFGELELDKIGPRDIATYKAAKLQAGLLSLSLPRDPPQPPSRLVRPPS
jgi:hypothetical protein